MKSLSKKILTCATVALVAGTPAEILASDNYSGTQFRELETWERGLSRQRGEIFQERAVVPEKLLPPPSF